LPYNSFYSCYVLDDGLLCYWDSKVMLQLDDHRLQSIGMFAMVCRHCIISR
jgi:hypothetical protein